jgi:SAM-dependent methyltransferase
MATVTQNKLFWDVEYRWPEAGDEWSEPWGSPQAQWFGSLLPRIFPFLGGRILEIASGHGRWTEFLAAHSESLVAIDVASSCVEHCRRRFAGRAHLEFHVNDGLTFPMVADHSIDFAFSFDSLVHAESEVISSYFEQLARVLKPGAAAFLHHSNLGGVRASVWHRMKRRISGRPEDRHWRAASMSAALARQFAQRVGMSCLQQELVPWGTSGPLLIDCLTTLVNRAGLPCAVIENRRFLEEAAAIKRISSKSWATVPVVMQPHGQTHFFDPQMDPALASAKAAQEPAPFRASARDQEV